ncbi:MAG TPA: glycoside hydrolase family 44 protein, partial [Vicinamibacterales bacterium]
MQPSRSRNRFGGAAVLGVGLAACLITVGRAQPPALTLNVDVSAQRNPISPHIYGLNFAKPSFAQEIALPVRRWGGNLTTRYNFQLNATNHGSDWFFHNNNAFDPFTSAEQTADQWIAQNAPATDSLITVPMAGFVAKDASQSSCGFPRAEFPVQDHFDTASGFPDCGDGLNGGAPVVGNDPADTSTAVTQSFVGTWASHLVATHGAAGGGGVKFYALDNEPGLWHETHRDVHPSPFTYDESFDRGSAYAQAVKSADPGALLLGPVQDGWLRYFYASWRGDGSEAENDRDNHGGTEFVAWYLQQMRAFEQAHPGHRLLDYLDLHFYPQNGVDQSLAGDASNQALRLRSTRALWDATYVDESWIADAGPDGGIVRLIPRMRDWVNGSYPGTKLAVTEYNWGGLEHINGALTQAEILGIFGREGLDLATLWAYPDSSNGLGYDHFETLPGAYAFRMYRNYDGAGSRFGDTSVSATSSDQAQLSIFAAERASDSALTLMIINKTITTSVPATVNIAGFAPGSTARLFRYSDANLNAIVSLPDQPIAGSSFNLTFPANSITLVVVARAAAAAPTVVTGAAGAIGAFAATLNGTANPRGAVTTARFEYGLTTTYGSTTPVQAMGSGVAAAAIGGGAVSGLT